MNDAEFETQPELSDSLRSILADLIGGLGCCAGAILARAQGSATFRAHVGLGQDAADSYLSLWHRRDPWLLAVRGPFGGRAFRGEDLVGSRLLRGSQFHTQWLAPNGLGSAAFAEIGHSPEGTDLLCVWRAAGCGSITRTEVPLLRAIASLLGMLLRQHELTGGAAVAAEVVAHTSVPIVLLQGNGTILWANSAAAMLWECDGPLRRLGNRVTFRSGTHGPRFAQAVSNAAQPGARPSLLGVQTDAGVVAMRLQPLVLRSGTRVVALTGSVAQTGVPSAATIAATLGLTRAQAEVAALLCRGLATAVISARIGVSQHTLNGHLRELYDRLRVENRVQAVVRVLGASAALALLSPSVTDGANGAAFDACTPK